MKYRKTGAPSNMYDTRKAGAVALLNEKGLGGAVAIYEGNTEAYEENTVRDIVGKLVKYGSVSDKQLAFVGALLKRIEDRPAREAREKAAYEAAAPVPITNDRINITGEVLTVKIKDGRFGSSLKMLIKHNDGYKLWGTVPAVLSSAQRGDRVEFDATVKPSDDDPKFGFFNRPTNARFRAAEVKGRELDLFPEVAA